VGVFDAPTQRRASAAASSSGAGSAIACENARKLSILADVTAASGTSPTLLLSVEWSHDGGTTWFAADPVDVFSSITAAGKRAKLFDVKAPHARVVWTLGGTTPSFTFALHSYAN
jgi:hypothetical protein